MDATISMNSYKVCFGTKNPKENKTPEHSLYLQLWIMGMVNLKKTKQKKKKNTKGTDKIAYVNSADPDQTAPEEAVWSGSTLFGIPLRILRNNYWKSKIYVKIIM